jgi:hypothetical protein
MSTEERRFYDLDRVHEREDDHPEWFVGELIEEVRDVVEGREVPGHPAS